MNSRDSIRKGKSKIFNDFQRTIRIRRSSRWSPFKKEKGVLDILHFTESWTILGSSGQTGLGIQEAFPETFGVRVLPHIVDFLMKLILDL